MEEVHRVKVKMLMEGLKLIGIGGLFCVSLIFFHMRINKLTIFIWNYIFLIVSTGALGLFSIKGERNEKAKSVYRALLIVCIVVSVIVSCFSVGLVCWIAIQSDVACTEILEKDCSGLQFYLLIIFFLIYIGTSISVLLAALNAFKISNDYNRIVFRSVNSLVNHT